MKHPAAMRTFILRLFFISAAVNFVWEMAQMPLYENMPFDSLMSWWLCFRASLGDGIIVAFIWAIGAVLFREQRWFEVLTPLRAAILLTTGALIAVGIEYVALLRGRWSYSALMPLVPLLDVGLSPFLQLLVLPLPLMRWSAHGKRN